MKQKLSLGPAFLLLLFLISGKPANAQKILQDWVKHLKAVPSGEQFSARAGVDAEGDAYWCANTQDSSSLTYEVHLIKYDSSGQQLWANHYVGAGGLTMTDFETLGNGDSYVYGIDYGAGTGSSQASFLLKHNADGELLWMLTFDPLADQIEYPDQFFISPVNGDVILTAYQSEPDYTLFVARYSPDGIPVWQTTVEGCEAGDIIMDEDDQIHLAATYHWGNENSDMYFAYLRFDDAGTLMSMHLQTGGGISHALETAGKGRTIGLDKDGSVYALAWVEVFPNNDSTWTHIMLKKFGSDGQQVWKKRLEAVKGGYPEETATLVTDAATGQAMVVGGWGMWKYDTDGTFAGGWYDRRREFFDACQFDQHYLFPLSSGNLVVDGDSGKLSLIDWSDDYEGLYVKGRASIEPLNNTAIAEPDAAHIALYVTWSFNDSVSLHRVVLRNDVATGAETIQGSAMFGIYPNPASDYTIIHPASPCSSPIQVTVFDQAGILMTNFTFDGTSPLTLQTGNWSPGLYQVQVTSEGARYREKLIILR